MKYKASLHAHIDKDIIDNFIKHSAYDLIDEARKNGIRILALTGHKKFHHNKDYASYAKTRGVLLIPGIELSLKTPFKKNHCLVLNCKKDIEGIKTFEELREYKKIHPEIYVMAPHPAYGFSFSMGIRKLIEFIDLFDGIEHSWFYTRFYNPNKKALSAAKNKGKPVVATADIHSLDYIATDYCVIRADRLSTDSVIRALKAGKLENVTRPKHLYEIASYGVAMIAKKYAIKAKDYIFDNPIRAHEFDSEGMLLQK